MVLVQNKSEILKNVTLLDDYITKAGEKEKEFALALIKKGTCFIVLKNEGSYKFYPSRFIGYSDNNIDAHLNNEYKDGKETNPAISSILGCRPAFDLELEKEYKKYCRKLKFTPNQKGSFGVERKFWPL
ncbi:hypothetical protein [Clostridium akagii]|uniref:hypothetical protein n=1 Tax=Clostridium akagii TaxID=91623 RepID=UPI000690F89F|nr:hypothetical protein [Clostridium akagii]